MGQNLEEFKRFVKIHPGLNNVILTKQRSWQDIYEEWTFYKEDSRWDIYKDSSIKETISLPEVKEVVKEDIKEEVKSGTSYEDMMKNALAYVKKINPDTVSKTVTNAQKLLALVSGLGIGTGAAVAKNSATGDPLFDKRFDEWY
ncbi:MAG: spore coat protein YlbD [bacterium]